MNPNQDAINAHMANLAKIIKESGWVVQGVFPTVDDPGAAFAYTIGLTDAGLPELLISGNLKHELMQTLLNSIAQLHIAEEFVDGDVIEPSRGVANVAFRVRECAKDAPVQQAWNYYLDPQRLQNTVRVLQVVWPDAKGAYPDSMFYDANMAQPLY